MKGQRDIASFVLRFTQDLWEDTQGDPRIEWRGSIRHVQSDEERHFTDITEAMTFIQQSLMKLTLDSVQHSAAHLSAQASPPPTKSSSTSEQSAMDSTPTADAATSAQDAAAETYQQKALRESFKLWEKFTSSYTSLVMDAMEHAAERSIQQTEALKKQVDRTIENASSAPLLRPWWLLPPFAPPSVPQTGDAPEVADQQAVLDTLAALQQQIAELSDHVVSLEAEIKALREE